MKSADMAFIADSLFFFLFSAVLSFFFICVFATGLLSFFFICVFATGLLSFLFFCVLATGLLSGAFLSVIISAGLLATAGFSAFISLASAVVFFISCLLFTGFSLSRFGSDGFLASGLSAFSDFSEAVFSFSADLPADFSGSSAIAFLLN